MGESSTTRSRTSSTVASPGLTIERDSFTRAIPLPSQTNPPISGITRSRHKTRKHPSKDTHSLVKTTMQQMYYHKIGTDQSEDVLVFEMPENPTWLISGEVSDDGNTLIIYVSESCKNANRLFYARLVDQSLPDRESSFPLSPSLSFSLSG